MALLLTNDEILQLVDIETTIDIMDGAFAMQAEGGASEPERIDVDFDAGWLRVLAMQVETLNVYGLKILNLSKSDGVRYLLAVYNLDDGTLKGLADAQAITALRTGATAASAARRLAPPDVPCMAMIGTGTAARAQFRALQAVRPSEEIRVFSRSVENRQRFIDEMAQYSSAALLACDSVDEAVDGANLIAMATKASAPILERRHVGPGLHLSSIGSSRRDQRELAPDVFAAADLIVCDTVDQVARDAGDAADAVAEGTFDPSQASELHALISGSVTPPPVETSFTLFKSVGTALQDLALVSEILDRAGEHSMGRDLGEFPVLKPFT